MSTVSDGHGNAHLHQPASRQYPTCTRGEGPFIVHHACSFNSFLFPHFSIPLSSVPLLGPREAQLDRKQLWKLFWLTRANFGFSVSCGAMPQTLLFTKKSTLPWKSPQSVQCCFNSGPFVCMCVSGLPICNRYHRFCQKADCQAREERRAGANSLFSSLSISVSWLLSRPHSPFVLPPHPSLFLFSFKQKQKYFFFFSSLFFLIPLHLSSILLGRSSARGLRPHRSSHHPPHRLREKRSQANKLRDLTARNHEMMSSLLSGVDIPGHKANSRPFRG